MVHFCRRFLIIRRSCMQRAYEHSAMLFLPYRDVTGSDATCCSAPSECTSRDDALLALTLCKIDGLKKKGFPTDRELKAERGGRNGKSGERGRGPERPIARTAAGLERDCSLSRRLPATRTPTQPYSVCLKNSPSFLFSVFFSHVDDRPVFPPAAPRPFPLLQTPSPPKNETGAAPLFPLLLLITFSGIDPSIHRRTDPSLAGHCAWFNFLLRFADTK